MAKLAHHPINHRNDAVPDRKGDLPFTVSIGHDRALDGINVLRLTERQIGQMDDLRLARIATNHTAPAYVDSAVIISHTPSMMQAA